MTEKTFNKYFSSFILIGMTLALTIATYLRFGDSGAGRAMLLISAFGSFMGVLSTVCSANGLIITFLFGLLDVSIYAFACFYGHKYGNALLHLLYFVPMQFVGFYQWRRRGAADSKSSVKARRLTLRQWMLCIAVFIVGGALAYLVLSSFDHTSSSAVIKTAVLLDVLPFMCNLIGQYLMSTAYMEQWVFWIGVNIFSIMMWATSMQGASDSYAVIYIIKYSFYLLNSFNGLKVWSHLSRGE